MKRWQRVLLGAIAGWFVATLLGAIAIAWLRVNGHVDEGEAPYVAGLIVWAGIGLGAGLGWSQR